MRQILQLAIFTSALLASPVSHALDEATVTSTIPSTALPYFYKQSGPQPQVMISKIDNVRIAYRIFPATAPGKPKGVVLFVNGRTEYMPKYAELIYDFQQSTSPMSAYTFILYDHRGQGESQRLLGLLNGQNTPNNPDYVKGYVANYQDYISDLDQILNQVVVKVADGAPIFMLSHSTGGGVAVAYLESPTYLQQKNFKISAYVSVSPLLGIVLPKPFQTPSETSVLELEVSQDAGEAAGSVIDVLKAKQFATGGPNSWNSPFAGNNVNTSENRYNAAIDIERGNAAMNLPASPNLIVAGPTYEWVKQVLAMGHATRVGAFNLSTPTRILRAGLDTVVLPEFDDLIAAEAPKGLVEVESVPYQASMHEILMETDPIREAAKASIAQFFSAH